MDYINIVGGFFRALLTFPSEYPLLPPKMKFVTPIFHPNSEWLHPDPDPRDMNIKQWSLGLDAPM